MWLIGVMCISNQTASCIWQQMKWLLERWRVLRAGTEEKSIEGVTKEHQTLFKWNKDLDALSFDVFFWLFGCMLLGLFEINYKSIGKFTGSKNCLWAFFRAGYGFWMVFLLVLLMLTLAILWNKLKVFSKINKFHEQFLYFWQTGIIVSLEGRTFFVVIPCRDTFMFIVDNVVFKR